MDSNDASYKLCLAKSLLDVLLQRFEGQAEALLKVFGGQSHSDVHMIHLLYDLVTEAKSIIDELPPEPKEQLT